MRNSTAKSIRILIVDDSAEFLELVQYTLASNKSIEIVGKAFSGMEGFKLTSELAPDVVVMDLSMPTMNGLEATRLIKKLPSPPPVIILTFHDGKEFSALAELAGADDFITKSEFGSQLVPALIRLCPNAVNFTANECA